MKKFINLEPVHQTGHNCKTTAIATVDQYFGEQLGFEPIPLHKNNKTAPISIRQLAKTKGSVQGELLEIRQLSEIFADIGYETELIDIQDNYNEFQNNVTNNIQKGNLVVACFAVDRTTGLPSTNYERNNEHCAILNGFNNETGELEITHWNQRIKTTMKDFYDSSMVLLKQRDPEYYVNVKDSDKAKKYDLHTDQTGQLPSTDYKKSITPAPNSGFRGKLLVIKQPQLQNFLNARERLLNPKSSPSNSSNSNIPIEQERPQQQQEQQQQEQQEQQEQQHQEQQHQEQQEQQHQEQQHQEQQHQEQQHQEQQHQEQQEQQHQEQQHQEQQHQEQQHQEQQHQEQQHQEQQHQEQQEQQHQEQQHQEQQHQEQQHQEQQQQEQQEQQHQEQQHQEQQHQEQQHQEQQHQEQQHQEQQHQEQQQQEKQQQKQRLKETKK